LFKMRFPDAGSQELISLIDSSAHRGAEMVRQVTAFARGVEGRRVEVRVRQLIEELEILSDAEFQRSIQVITFIPQDLYPLMGDPSQLEKVLRSLCENARDAMPGGGKLTISAANLTLDKHFAGMHLEASPGPHVLLQVVDTGIGISPENLDRIFDPFFTTKEVGKGPGLGLSVVLAIVKSHGGFIRTFSEVGKGTTFKIYLPARPELPAPLPDSAATTNGLPRGGGELILVVDDEAPVRLVTRHLLETFGYRVVVAAGGEEALAIHASQESEIAAVLTDMMMPGMDGPTIIRSLRQRTPKLPIIAASGVPPQGPDGAAAHAAVNHFLPKPYSAEALLKALRDLVGDRRLKS
jgi:CheY-like chemotaxis protein